MTATIVNQIDLDSVTLHEGAHGPNDSGKWCALELVAYMAGEKWSDHPECVCPVTECEYNAAR